MRKSLALAVVLGLAIVASAPAQVDYNNGPMITTVGAGFGGGDVSNMDTTIHNNLGFGCSGSTTANNRLADDFVVPCGQQWAINFIETYAYQTQVAPFSTTSTLVGGNYRIWNKKPGTSGATVVFDFGTTNQMQSTGFTNIYRTTTTLGPANQQRPIFFCRMNGNSIVLNPGRYWLDFAINGGTVNATTNVFTPPITIVGTASTGDANQFAGLFIAPVGTAPGPGNWGQSIFSGTTAANSAAQGLPFRINYNATTVAGCWSFDISQPGGPGTAVALVDSNGPVNGTAVHLMVFNDPTSIPNGPVFGLNIPYSLLIAELTFPLSGIFVTTLDPTGNAAFLVPGVPAGFLITYVGLGFDAIGNLTNIDTPKAYTVL